MKINKSRLKEIIAEELTRSDKDEIKRMISSELKKMVEDEVENQSIRIVNLMIHLMMASMIAVNVYKIDSANIPEDSRARGYIPAPLVPPRAGDNQYIEHMPYTPVIMCTDLDNVIKKDSGNFTCGEHSRIWLKI